MDVVLDIPENFRISFKRMKRILPTPIRHDPAVQKTTLAYLKLGGERLARHYIRLVKYRLKELEELQRMAREEELAKEKERAKEEALLKEKERAEEEERLAKANLSDSDETIPEEKKGESPVAELKETAPVEETDAESAEDDITTVADKAPGAESEDVGLPEETAGDTVASVGNEALATESGNSPQSEETAEEPITATAIETLDDKSLDDESSEETVADHIPVDIDEIPVTQSKLHEKTVETVAPVSVTASDASPTMPSATKLNAYPSKMVNWECLIPEKFQIQDETSE